MYRRPNTRTLLQFLFITETYCVLGDVTDAEETFHGINISRLLRDK